MPLCGLGGAGVTSIILTPREAWVIGHLRKIKSEQNGKGHGTLRIDVVDGFETLVKREISERPPR